MSTRGALGFRNATKDKVTYNHSDSYPSWLGIQVMSFLHDTPETELKEIANRIELVSDDVKPTPEQIEAYKKHADVKVSSQSLQDWYCLLRNTQGDLSHYRNGLRHMIDSHDFLKDSLFCEWAYIINTDSGELEIYRGFNDKKYVINGGRYAKYSLDDGKNRSKYYGVALLATLKFSDIRTMTEENIKHWCEALQKSIYESRN